MREPMISMAEAVASLKLALRTVTRAPVKFIAAISLLGGISAFILGPYLLATFLADERVQGEGAPQRIVWTGTWALVSGLLAAMLVLSLQMADDAREKARRTGGRLRWLFLKRSWILLFPAGGIPFLSEGIHPRAYKPRESEVRMLCSNNIKSIWMALEQYGEKSGRLPPAVVRDAAGKPMHSWRVLVLPYLDQENLYAEYDFAEPWDGPHNRRLWDKMPLVYRCPAEPRTQRSITSYFLLTGKGTLFEGDKSPPLLEPGVCGKMMLIVETADSGTIWTQPQDMAVEQMSPFLNDSARPSIRSKHARGACVGLGDGSVRFITERDELEAFAPGILRRRDPDAP
jgi:hypothetical protein